MTEGDGEASEAMLRQREQLTAALTALRNIVEANPRLAALLAARPALAPLLNCLEPICRCCFFVWLHSGGLCAARSAVGLALGLDVNAEPSLLVLACSVFWSFWEVVTLESRMLSAYVR